MADIFELTVGQVVFSKRGRDRGGAFFILAVDGDYVWLADGRLRPVQRPKKKKRMHVQPIKSVNTELAKKFTDGALVLDAELRKALEPFNMNQTK